MILQVHDELLFEVRQTELDEVKRVVIEGMEAETGLDVPLKISVETGDNWGRDTLRLVFG